MRLLIPFCLFLTLFVISCQDGGDSAATETETEMDEALKSHLDKVNEKSKEAKQAYAEFEWPEFMDFQKQVVAFLRAVSDQGMGSPEKLVDRLGESMNAVQSSVPVELAGSEQIPMLLDVMGQSVEGLVTAIENKAETTELAEKSVELTEYVKEMEGAIYAHYMDVNARMDEEAVEQ